MPFGTTLLVLLSVLIYFGVAHRALDRLRLSDRGALAIIAAMIVGGWFNLFLARKPVELVVNVGGGLVPLALAFYLVVTADKARERWRSVVAALVAGAAVYSLGLIMPSGPEGLPRKLIDRLYLAPLVAGTVAYLAGRSRRAAFVAGIMAIILSDAANFTLLVAKGIPGRTWVGGAGAYDATVISGLLAVFLAEVVGETRERLSRGRGEGDA